MAGYIWIYTCVRFSECNPGQNDLHHSYSASDVSSCMVWGSPSCMGNTWGIASGGALMYCMILLCIMIASIALEYVLVYYVVSID